jgi:hypothetical protein
VDIEPLTVGPSVEIPDDVALIVETGRWGCGCPTEDLIRVYRDSSGAFRYDELLTVDKLGLGPRRAANTNNATEAAPYIRSFARPSAAVASLDVTAFYLGGASWRR